MDWWLYIVCKSRLKDYFFEKGKPTDTVTRISRPSRIQGTLIGGWWVGMSKSTSKMSRRRKRRMRRRREDIGIYFINYHLQSQRILKFGMLDVGCWKKTNFKLLHDIDLFIHQPQLSSVDNKESRKRKRRSSCSNTISPIVNSTLQTVELILEATSKQPRSKNQQPTTKSLTAGC